MFAADVGEVRRMMTGNEILYAFILIVLFFAAVTDARYKEINGWCMITGSAAVLLIRIFGQQNMWASFYGACLGFAVLIIAKLTAQSVGYGDGITIVFLGIGLGWQKSLAVLMTALLLMSVSGLLMLAAGKVKRKTQWPMVPWLLISVVIGVMTW